MEQLEMNINDTSDFLSENGYGRIMCGHMTPKLEARFGWLVLEAAKEEGHLPAIATAEGKPIPRTCLPKGTKEAEPVTGNQFLILTSIKDKPKNRATIAEEIGTTGNSVSSSLATLKRRHLIHIKRKQKRTTSNGSAICVYGISRAGLIALEAAE